MKAAAANTIFLPKTDARRWLGIDAPRAVAKKHVPPVWWPSPALATTMEAHLKRPSHPTVRRGLRAAADRGPDDLPAGDLRRWLALAKELRPPLKLRHAASDDAARREAALRRATIDRFIASVVRSRDPA